MEDRFWPALVEDPRETQEAEYKGAVPFQLNEKGLVRSCLAMSNTENGGRVVVGVDNDNGTLILTGLTDADITSYRLQHLAHSIQSYGSTGMQVFADLKEHDGKMYIVLEVLPFEEYPIICTKHCRPNESGGAREGVLYYRNEKYENIPASDATYRRIMERATRLAMVRWAPTLREVMSAQPAKPEDAQRFRDELEGLL